MTAELSDEVRAALTAGQLGHLVTINPDGSPQLSLVWIGVEDDEIVVGHLGQGRKLTNIERDPRVACPPSRQTARTRSGCRTTSSSKGRPGSPMEGPTELLRRLAHTYLGPDVKFPPFDDPPPGRAIRYSVPTRSVASVLGPDAFG